MNTPAPFPVPDHDSLYAPSFYELTGEWFRQVGGAYLRTLTVKPDALDLADYLLEEARRHEPRGLYPGTGHGAVKTQDVVARAEGVAAWLLKTHSNWHMPRFTREQAVKGGKAQRRPKVKLKAYAKLMKRLEATGEVLTPVEIAAELDCTRQFVYTLQKQYATTWLDLSVTTSTAALLDEVMAAYEPTITLDRPISIFTRQPVTDEFFSLLEAM